MRPILITLSAIIILVTLFSTPLTAEEPTAERSLKINFETIGEGQPIVMLHGFGYDLNQMKGCMEPLFKGRTGWKRIYIDLPGMGRSSGKEWIRNSDKILEIVSSLVNTETVRQKIVLVGHSYGAYIALGLFHERAADVDGLLLINPVTVPYTKDKKIPLKTVLVKDETLLASLPPEDRKEFEQIAVIQTKPVWERFKEEILPGIRMADPVFLTNLRAKGYSFSYNIMDFRPMLDKPVLIFAGRQDFIVGYHDPVVLLESFPYGEYHVLDGAGPMLPIERPEAFNHLVGRWLDQLEKNWKVLPPPPEKKADEVITIDAPEPKPEEKNEVERP
jgi:pimeloyl-ACP methyl ester carboxylesterase